MSAHNENARLEAFCDGVFAIAITLLVLEVKVPPETSVHSVQGLWMALAHLWPSFFAFAMGFIIILIAWYNHHSGLKLVSKSSPKFVYANGFLLMTVIILPFTTALIAEYIQTPYAQPAIFVYCLSLLLHNFGWNLVGQAIFKPVYLGKSPNNIPKLKETLKYTRYGFFAYLFVVLVAWWYPYVALSLQAIMWVIWLYFGITIKETDNSPAAVSR
jgi:uncharacterized membrane protein